jgi:phage-related baseplate assembly protein
MFGFGISVGIVKTVMVDWNILMRESLSNMMPNQERRKKKFFDEMKTKKIIKILEENKITNVVKNTPYKNDKKTNA